MNCCVFKFYIFVIMLFTFNYLCDIYPFLVLYIVFRTIVVICSFSYVPNSFANIALII